MSFHDDLDPIVLKAAGHTEEPMFDADGNRVQHLGARLGTGSYCEVYAIPEELLKGSPLESAQKLAVRVPFRLNEETHFAALVNEHANHLKLLGACGGNRSAYEELPVAKLYGVVRRRLRRLVPLYVIAAPIYGLVVERMRYSLWDMPSTDHANKAMGLELAEACLKLFQLTKMIHTDLHPGNVMLRWDRSGIAFVDLDSLAEEGAVLEPMKHISRWCAPERRSSVQAKESIMVYSLGWSLRHLGVPGCDDVISACLQSDPGKRPSLANVVCVMKLNV